MVRDHGKERKGKVKYKQMKSSLNSCQLHGTLSQKKNEESGDRRERDELLNIFGMRDTGKKT